VLSTMQNRSFIQGDSYEYCNSFEVNLCIFFVFVVFIFLSRDSNRMLILFFYLEIVTECFFFGYDSSSFL
jgi:hypothetical protein